MELFISLFSLCLLHKTMGLQLKLDSTPPRSAGQQALCGVLTCEENQGPSTGLGGSEVSSSLISSLSLFKNTRTGLTSTDDSNRSNNVVAVLTPKQPRISRMSDGMKVDGHLEGGQATIRLELTHQEDCRAEYTCEVGLVDAQGRESVNTYRLRHLQGQNAPQADNAPLETARSLQLLLLSQTLEARLARLETSFEHKLDTLAARLGSLKEDVQDKIASMQEDLKTHDEIRALKLESKIESRTMEIENKIESRVMDKLCQLEDRFSVATAKFCYGEDIRGDIEDKFAKLKSELRIAQREATTDITFAFSERFEATNTALTSVSRLLTDLLARERRGEHDLHNLTEVIQQIYTSNGEMSQVVGSNLSQLKNALEVGMKQLSAEMNIKSAGILSALTDLFSHAKTSKLLTNDILMPKVCRKGMSSVLTFESFPYSVIRPSAENGPNISVPFLCDAVTDGGGWIIIQRRTKGNVDFYRDWATYKNGFGSLDEDFWLGNENIHAITASGTYELRVELRFQGKSAFAHYSSFSLGSEENSYALRLGAYDGTAGDSLGYHRGKPFSTHDRDNDGMKKNCAQKFLGSWWYGSKWCHTCNLNGKWQASGWQGPNWTGFSKSNPVSFSEMKIRFLGNEP